MTAKKQADEVRNFPELSEAEKTAAEKEGVKAALAQSAQTNFSTRSATESVDPVGDRWPSKSDIQQYAGLLDLDPDAFNEKVDEKAENPVAEDKVAGLLGLERAGKNRTTYVEAMMKRLKVDDVTEVTNAGPAWTNDVTPTKMLGKGKKK